MHGPEHWARARLREEDQAAVGQGTGTWAGRRPKGGVCMGGPYRAAEAGIGARADDRREVMEPGEGAAPGAVAAPGAEPSDDADSRAGPSQRRAREGDAEWRAPGEEIEWGMERKK